MEEDEYDWVELLEARTGDLMYIHLKNGDCRYNPPPNVKIKMLSENQWWELYDIKTGRHYYHNAKTMETVWNKPFSADIIPLAKIQDLGELNRKGSVKHESNAKHSRPNDLVVSPHNNNPKFSKNNKKSPNDGPGVVVNSTAEQRVKLWLQQVEESKKSLIKDSVEIEKPQRNSNGSRKDSMAKQKASMLSRRRTFDTGNNNSGNTSSSNENSDIEVSCNQIRPSAPVCPRKPRRSVTSSTVTNPVRGHSMRANSGVSADSRNEAGVSKKMMQTRTPQPVTRVLYAQENDFPANDSAPLKSGMRQSPSNTDLNNDAQQSSTRSHLFPRTNPAISRTGNLTTGVLTLPRTFLQQPPNPPSHANENHMPLVTLENSSQTNTNPPRSESIPLNLANSANNAKESPTPSDQLISSQNEDSAVPGSVAARINQFQKPDPNLMNRSSLKNAPHTTTPQKKLSLGQLDIPTSQTTNFGSKIVSSNNTINNQTPRTRSALIGDINTNSSRIQSQSSKIIKSNGNSAMKPCQLLSVESNIIDDDGPVPVPPPRSSSTLGRHSGAILSLRNSEQSVIASSGQISMATSVLGTSSNRGVPVASIFPGASGMNSVLRVANKNLPNVTKLSQPAMSPVEEYSEPINNEGSALSKPSMQNFLKSNQSSPKIVATRPISMVANGSVNNKTQSSSLMQTSNMLEKSPTNTASSQSTATLESNKILSNIDDSEKPKPDLNNSTDLTEDDIEDESMDLDVHQTIEDEEPIMIQFQPNMFPFNSTAHIPNKRMTLVDASTSSQTQNNIMNASMYDIGSLSEVSQVSKSLSHTTSPSSPLFFDIVNRLMIDPVCALYTHYPWPKNIINIKNEDKDVLSLMSYTQSAFKKRILASSDKSSMKNQCEETFKLIQQYMGDKKVNQKQRAGIPNTIIQKALSQPQLRDEIYAQLCKQTTANTNLPSLICGWELMCLCLYYFPPNNAFRDHLFSYLTTRYQFYLTVERCISEELSILRPQLSIDENSGTQLLPAAGSSSVNVTRKFTGSINSNSSFSNLQNANSSSAVAGSSLALAHALAEGSDPSGIQVKPTTVVAANTANSNCYSSGSLTSTVTSASGSHGGSFFNKQPAVSGSSKWNRQSQRDSTVSEHINGSQSSGLNQLGSSGNTLVSFITSPFSAIANNPIVNSGSAGNGGLLKTSSDFPYGPWAWVHTGPVSYIKASLRWFQRSIQLSVKSLEKPPNFSKTETSHVKDFILKPGIFGCTLNEMMKLQYYRFPNLKVPWLPIFLVEELLRGNGHKSEGIFRLSSDLDEVNLIRSRLEKLFEPFRILQVWDPVRLKSDTDQSNLPSKSTPRFDIFRPAPEGWSLSQKIYEPEIPEDDSEAVVTSEPLLNFPAITGDFHLPLRPRPIGSQPVQFMLLTPSISWPCCLTAELGMDLVGNYPTNQPDPHVAAALLKMWLREMAEPMIPICLEQEALRLGHASSNESSVDTNPCPLQNFIRKIPPLNRRCLIYLLQLLQFLAKPEHSERTRMDAKNLSTVIGPNLFRAIPTSTHIASGIPIVSCLNGESISKGPGRDLLETIRLQTEFTRLLIERLDCNIETEYLNQTEIIQTDNMFRLNSPIPPLVRISDDRTYIPCSIHP